MMANSVEKHWLIREAEKAIERKMSYNQARLDIYFNVHGAMDYILSNDNTNVGDIPKTDSEKLKEIVELFKNLEKSRLIIERNL